MRDQTEFEEAIFDAALRLENSEERAEYLSKACGHDAVLRRQVDELLQAHGQAGPFLEKVATGLLVPSGLPTVKVPGTRSAPVESSPTEGTGDQIGRYKLLQKIGEGGCGVVYMAEQEEPVRRRVALKIIKAGMDTKQVIARFEAERQALAMMDHPNIARVLDAGTTDRGRPYFVMELVRGIRMTDYCDQNHLSTEKRLELFMQVCHAIQHAHQKGIIHRDIKPSNILVTLHDGVPVPVIIDFGVAKATEQRLTDKTLFTAFEQFIGTPAYMSPEQAEMSRLDIDTRSDIYSLGVLLYELLTGKTPFDGRALLESGLDEMRRTIREKEPVRPSTCLSTMIEAELMQAAKQRQDEPVRLIHRIRGDLDWVVMKCLEKDRTRRYETANSLALDLQHYLHNEPVLARPPSRLYLFQKMVRRNRVVFVAACAVTAALVAGLTTSTYLYLLERKAYHRAVLAERSQRGLREEAERARSNEIIQRRSSEENARQWRLNSYAADVSGAFLAWQAGNLGRAVDLLERQAPVPGQEDLRGFEWHYLWQQARGDELVSFQHNALVSCAVFAPDGRTLGTASYDGTVRFWDLASKQVTRTLPGFEQQFGWRYIAYSPDGKWFAGMHQGQLTVWSCANREFSVRFERLLPVKVLAFSPDSSHLVGWGGSSLVSVDTTTWQVTTMNTQLSSASYPAVAIDQSGKTVALASEEVHAIEVWNLETLQPAGLFPFPGRHDLAFVSLAWSPKGLLAATTWAGRLLLLDGRTGQELAATNAHAGSIFGLAFTRNGETLVTAGHDQLIHFWSVPSLALTGTLRGHQDEIWSLAFSPDGRLLCTAGKDGTTKVWGLETKPPPLLLTNGFARAFTADGKLLVTLSEPASELSVDLWATDNSGTRTTKTLPVTDLSNLVRIVLSEDARFLGIGKKDGTLEVWSLDAGRLLATARASEPGLTDLTVSRNGTVAAFGTERGLVAFWNLKTGEVKAAGPRQPGRIKSVRFSAGEQYLQVALQGREEDSLWDLSADRPLALPEPISRKYLISPDGKTLAGASTNYLVKLWDLPLMRERAVLKGHRWTIYSMAFSPDGRMIATGGGDSVTRLWEVETGQELSRPLRGHMQGVTSLVFSPDGRTLVTASTDGTVRAWHIATGRELFGLSDAANPQFSPDGRTLRLETSRGFRLLHVKAPTEFDADRGKL